MTHTKSGVAAKQFERELGVTYKTAWRMCKQIRKLMTDGLDSYWNLHKDGYKHDSVNHSKHYIRGTIYTQNIENFWSHLKRGIRGVYRQVSPKYLQTYANEYGFRYNHRISKTNMFYTLLDRVGR